MDPKNKLDLRRLFNWGELLQGITVAMHHDFIDIAVQVPPALRWARKLACRSARWSACQKATKAPIGTKDLLALDAQFGDGLAPENEVIHQYFFEFLISDRPHLYALDG